MKHKVLEVYYKKKLVGTLAETEDKLVAFQYYREWLKNGFSISPFSLPLRDNVFIPEGDSRRIFGGLFGVFDDSLPDSWGNLLMDRYLASKGVSRDSVSSIDRLAYIGESGMGALDYYPSHSNDFNISGLDYDSIAEECCQILRSKESDQLDILYDLGGSSGGSRPKILLKDDKGDWIVKFPMSLDDQISGKREYDYSICAKKSGIIMTETNLIPSKLCEGYFKTKRFDREDGEKILSLTFAGVLETDFRSPSCDYNTYMKLINILSREDKKQIEQLFMVMCFNVFNHNLDDHAKNFSILWKNDRWQLAPAYDLTLSNTYYGEHTTSVNGKGKNIEDDDLISVGVKAGLSRNKCKELINEVRTNSSDLNEYMANAKQAKAGKVELEDRLKEVQQ